MDVAMLEETARKVRRGILETVFKKQQGHVGGPLSITETLVYLLFHEMSITPEKPNDEDRDRLVLSKGHSAIALYVAMALRGYFPYEELDTFDEIDSRLQAHPDMTKLPGLDMSTGSLAQGMSAGVGMALGAKRLNKDFYTYVIIGDGESQEGQIWEAANIASKYKLDNLIVFLDMNGLQQYGWRGENGRRLPPEENQWAYAKWKGFGWDVWDVDGHDFYSLFTGVKTVKRMQNGKPKLLLTHTVKGKGVSFMENNFHWHSKAPTQEQLEKALAEIGGITS